MKIYAKTLNPELFDYAVYDLRNDDYNLIFIDSDIDNRGYLSDIHKLIEDYYPYNIDVYFEHSIKSYIEYMLPKKENGKKYSPKEIHTIKKALDNDNKEETIKTCLSIIVGTKYTSGCLRGCSQGDYALAYYPKNTSQESINWVEAWYFGTGTEIMVHVEDTTPENADEVVGFTFYTASWNNEDLKKEIKEYYGCKPEDDAEVVLWKYSNTKIIKEDVYELASC